jgi:aspartyl-tRNA(Asn)/glutamyl-tRNA(Gln) amidotransferase subunit B
MTDEGQLVSIDRIEEIIEEKGLAIVSDIGQLEAVIDSVIANNEKSVTDFKGGKQQAVGALIGQGMRELKGADPKTVRQILIEKLSS